jgi:hypothetical protein
MRIPIIETPILIYFDDTDPDKTVYDENGTFIGFMHSDGIIRLQKQILADAALINQSIKEAFEKQLLNNPDYYKSLSTYVQNNLQINAGGNVNQNGLSPETWQLMMKQLHMDESAKAFKKSESESKATLSNGNKPEPKPKTWFQKYGLWGGISVVFITTTTLIISHFKNKST